MNEIIKPFLSEAYIVLYNLHFLRAEWFYAFIPLLLYLLLSYKTALNNRNWLSVVDTKLMPFVLSKSNGKKRHYPLLLVFIAASLCITALAGPVYKKLPQPVYREQSSLAVLLDLSQSMNASDIKPSRLSRARLELLDLLKTRKTGQTALIVYAADAFVVTPLTDDNTTIANLVPALETDMMPAQGSNLSLALAKAFSLFAQSGVIRGDILVITDDIRQRDESAIKKVTSQGHRLSIFAIGTADGGPIPLAESAGGGFLQDSNGAIVIPKVQPDKLQRYALTGNGLYTALQADDKDVNKLTRLFQSSAISADTRQDDDTDDLNADLWQEEGHWLLLPLLFFAALWARKGWLASLLPFAILLTLPVPQSAYADEAIKTGFDTNHLWSTADQKAMKDFEAGNNESAARNFTQNDWKASALYRHGDYAAAVETLKDTQNSDGFYNKGNALARLGKYKEAMAAYEKAIELNANNDDARYNHEQVKKALQQQKNQQQEQNQSQDQQQPDEQPDEQQEQQQSDQSQSAENSEQQNDQQQNQSSEEQAENQSSEQNQQAQTDTERDKKAEEESLKQRDAEAEKKQQQEAQQQYEQQDKNKEEQDNTANNDDNAEHNEIENREGEERPAEIEINPAEASITEDEKATEQWLKRIPDDPGGLLRRKFYYQYQQVPNQNDENEPW